MALVRSSDIAFELPVFTITAKGERWLCRRLDDLTRIPPVQLETGRFLDMKITDASGRRWVVRSIETIGRAESWTFLHVLFSPPDWRVDFILEELPAVPAHDWRPQQEDLGGLPDLVSSSGGPSGTTMSTMASQIDLEYPLVGFTRKVGVLAFDDPQTLTTCALVYVREETLIGMELIDNALRRWVVRSLIPEYPLPIRRWWQLSIPNLTFDLELEEIEPIGLEALKHRLLDDWELEDFEDEKAVRRASTLAAVLEAGHMQATGLL